MSAFFGIISLKELVNSESIEELARAMHKPLFAEPRIQKDATGKVVFGHLSFSVNPLVIPITNEEKNIYLTGHFRLDYKDELRQKLGIAPNNTSDAQMALLAYEKWGTGCVRHLEGDWAMAVYDTKKGKVFFAKDALAGISALYYTIRQEVIYFTSDLESLKAVNALPLALDKTELARNSFRLFGLTPGRTLLENVYHLVSGHFVEINNAGHLQQVQYCSVRDVAPIRYKDENDYFDHFKELFSRAVQTRLDPLSKNGIILSGGLDSSAVGAFAADFLAQEDRTLNAFTSVPAYLDHVPKPFQVLSNEQPLVEALLDAKKNIQGQFDNFKDLSISNSFLDDDILNLNTRLATSGSFWLNGIFQKAKDQKINRLFTGQLGNPIISWRGSFPYSSMLYNLQWIALVRQLYEEKKHRHIGWSTLIRTRILNTVRADLVGLKNRSRSLRKHPFVKSSILQDHILDTLDWDEINEHLDHLARYTSLHPSKSLRRNLVTKWNGYIGTSWYFFGLAKGITVADPTADWRLASFSMGIPEELWQKEGISKYLYKKSIGQNVPPVIVNNSSTMLQSADVWTRMSTDPGFKTFLRDIAEDRSLQQIVDYSKILRNWHLLEKEQNMLKRLELCDILMVNFSTCLLLKKNLFLYHKRST